MDVEKGNLGKKMETGDQIVILTYVCSSAVNCIIALQVLVYWNSAAKKKTA